MEEEVRRIREIIIVFLHVYRRMRLCVGVVAGKARKEGSKFITTAQSNVLNEKELSEEEKQNILRYIRPLPQYGTLYKEWEEQVMDMENIILRELGFTLYWIPGSHPHVFLLYFIKVLDIQEKRVAQVAWNHCNDSCRLDLCVRYPPEMTACAAIHLACFDNDDETSISLPLSPRPWWHAFVGSDQDEDLSIICNAILALGLGLGGGGGDDDDDDCVEGYMVDATKKYVVSLVDGGSFCDPGSFIWNAMD